LTSGIVQTQFYSSMNPNPIYPYGEALVTFGFENRGVVNGPGLVTRGFVWQLYDIWFDTEFYAPITTTWAAYGATLTSTTWTSPPIGMAGDYSL
jgi:hypothetical protein